MKSKIFCFMVATAVCVLVAGMIYGTYFKRERWKIFRSENHCILVEKSYRETVYTCDDGVIYRRLYE